MIKFLNKNIFKFKPSINLSYVQFSSTNNSDKSTKSNFELKIDEDCLDDEDLNYLSDRELKVESETDKLKAIKTLVDENFSLKKENGKLKYRIEHLLLTINSLEEKINTNKI
jgi:hypothetical protein